jgi:hypothetical protein
MKGRIEFGFPGTYVTAFPYSRIFPAKNILFGILLGSLPSFPENYIILACFSLFLYLFILI